ncbi:MAG: hypothetical protein HWE18_04715 [Gammaproteobacteria bacterium]|nr:hypothetical protein [Gammaproteobacteria bacterium]
MDVLFNNLIQTINLSYWQQIFAICGICLLLDALIMSQLKGPHRAERSHYLLSILSVVCYLPLYTLDSESFRHYWMQILLGLYLYDLAIIARDFRQLKSSYRVFYSVHHGMSLILFFVWHLTFVPFTDAMALGALLWVSSDVWRWAEQVWRLSGRYSSNRLRDSVWYLERGHRVLAYLIYLWVLDFSFNYPSELVLLASGLLMDMIDTYFQAQARRVYKLKQNLISSQHSTAMDSLKPKKKGKHAA